MGIGGVSGAACYGFEGVCANDGFAGLPSQRARETRSRPESVIHSPQSAQSAANPVFGSPTRQGQGSYSAGGLRVMNRSSVMSERSSHSEASGHERAMQELGVQEEDEEWKKDAMAGLHLAGVGGVGGHYGN